MNSWRAGDRVVVRGHRWTVLEAARFGDCETLRLARPSESRRVTRTLVVPFDRPRPADGSRNLRAVTPREALHILHRAGSSVRPFGGLRAAAACAIDLLPYQLEPAIAIVRDGWPRVLIADAVGLGKTIQAGLIANELRARTASARVLIVMPAGLRDQWTRELDAHFGITAIGADSTWLRQVASDIPPDVNPWTLPAVYLASHDFVKRPEVLRPLEDVRWDLVVVDEAHAATAASDRRAAIQALACRARHVVLLTATPHDGDARERAALCRLGAVAENSPLIVFRRTRVAPGAAAARRTSILAVQVTGPERRMHRLLETYTERIWREASARGDARARLASIVLRKRALSSAGALARSLRRRIELLADPAPAAESQLPLPIDDEDPLDDGEPLAALAAPGLADIGRERRLLGIVLESALHAARHESKLHRLTRLLRRVHEPVIVFTEYRDTLARLRDALAVRGLPAVLLHGGVTPAERACAQDLFNSSARLLLATDAAAEGLNLQQRCRLVVHYELPWNPARLEQRAGRVDRIGQARRVHEIALVAADTAERLVLQPIVRRAAAARRVGAGTRRFELFTESRIAIAIMAGQFPHAPDSSDVEDVVSCDSRLLVPDLERDAHAEAARLTIQRGWAPAPEIVDRSAERPIASALPSRSRPARTAMVYLLSIRDGDGDVLHSETVVISGRIADRSGRLSWAAIRSRAARIGEQFEPEASEWLRSRASGCLAATRIARDEALARTGARERELQELTASAARQLVQAGLFERRPPHRQAPPDRPLIPSWSGPDVSGPLSAEMHVIAVLFLPEPRSS